MRCAFDGLIIGAFAGLAFQVFEDVSYIYTAAARNFGQTSASTPVFVTRTLLGVTGHWTWTAVVGAGVIFLIGRPAEQPRRLLGVVLILSSMLFHFLWDSLSAITGGASWAIGLYAPVTLFNLAVFVAVYRLTVKRDRSWAHELLAPEVARGTITTGELDAAVGPRKQRKHFLKSQTSHRSAKHVLEAVTDLADTISDGDGCETPEIAHARREIARLRR